MTMPGLPPKISCFHRESQVTWLTPGVLTIVFLEEVHERAQDNRPPGICP